MYWGEYITQEKMDYYKKLNYRHMEKCRALADDVFGFSFGELIPKVFLDGIKSKVKFEVISDANDNYIAQSVVLPETCMVAGERLNVGFVGGVSVRPEVQKQGYMKKVMDMALDDMRTTCDFSVLWGHRQRYEYYGYSCGGRYYKHTVFDYNIEHVLKKKEQRKLYILPAESIEGIYSYIHDLNQSRVAYVERSLEYAAQILGGFHQKVYGILSDGRLCGYILTDKSADIITEMGLNENEMLPHVLKMYVDTFEKKKVVIMMPEYEKYMNECLCDMSEYYSIEQSGMCNVFRFAEVISAYLKLKHSTVGLTTGRFSAVLDGQPITILVTEEKVEVVKQADQDAVVLDKIKAQKLILTGESNYDFSELPKDWFPLSMFWYTSDNF